MLYSKDKIADTSTDKVQRENEGKNSKTTKKNPVGGMNVNFLGFLNSRDRDLCDGPITIPG
jgi:hypothetical protein